VLALAVIRVSSRGTAILAIHVGAIGGIDVDCSVVAGVATPDPIDPLVPLDIPFMLLDPASEFVPEPCPALPAVWAITAVERPIDIADTVIILRNIFSSFCYKITYQLPYADPVPSCW
jgi:hypothetical protein